MTTLNSLYEAERERLLLLADADMPQGEYAMPVFGSGDPASGLVLIGEAPGAEETAQHTPFVGKAGKQLDELLKLADIPREMLFITNTVKYRPVVRSAKTTRNRTPGVQEVRQALPLLEQEMALLKPLMIVTLGNTPLGAVLALCGGEKATVGSLHGTPKACMLNGRQTVLFPLYHPASAIYNRALLLELEADAKKMGEAFRGLR